MIENHFFFFLPFSGAPYLAARLSRKLSACWPRDFCLARIMFSRLASDPSRPISFLAWTRYRFLIPNTLDNCGFEIDQWFVKKYEKRTYNFSFFSLEVCYTLPWLFSSTILAWICLKFLFQFFKKSKRINLLFPCHYKILIFVDFKGYINIICPILGWAYLKFFDLLGLNEAVNDLPEPVFILHRGQHHRVKD